MAGKIKNILWVAFILVAATLATWHWYQNRITISVIIPVYNAEKYLKQCLDSIFEQSGTFEVIAVNDGSTDKSLDILQQYAQKHSNLKIIDQKNQGIAGARNTGIKHASNKYITFVDDDDWIEPDTFDLAIPYLKKDKPDVLLTNFYDVYDKEWVKQTKGEEAAKFVLDINRYPNRSLEKLALFSPFYAKDAYSDLFYDEGGVRARFFLRDFINKYNITFNNGIGEDISFVFKAYAHNPFIAVMNIPVYDYRNRADSVSKSARILKESRITLAEFQKSDEYKSAGRRAQMFMNDYWLGLIFVGISNLQRHGAPYGAGAVEAYEAYRTFDIYNAQELKSCRNYHKIRAFLEQVKFNQPL